MAFEIVDPSGLAKFFDQTCSECEQLGERNAIWWWDLTGENQKEEYRICAEWNHGRCNAEVLLFKCGGKGYIDEDLLDSWLTENQSGTMGDDRNIEEVFEAATVFVPRFPNVKTASDFCSLFHFLGGDPATVAKMRELADKIEPAHTTKSPFEPSGETR